MILSVSTNQLYGADEVETSRESDASKTEKFRWRQKNTANKQKLGFWKGKMVFFH